MFHQNFYCEKCDYTTSRQSQYDRHLLTAKHKILMNPNEKSSKIIVYSCLCGKQYKHMSSLCSHKKNCMHSINNTNPCCTILPNIQVEDNKDNTQIVSIMETLIKENQEF